MSKLSLVVLISGNGSNLQAIIDQIESQYLNAIITAVISNRPNAYGLKRAEKSKIPAISLDHSNFNCREQFDLKLIETINQFNPDCIVLAGFMRILTTPFFEHFKPKIINIHPSLLPKFQGLHTHKRALENKELKHGVSVHVATQELDSGPVIAQASFQVSTTDDETKLKQKCQQLEYILYPYVLKLIIEQSIIIKTDTVLLNKKNLLEPLQLENISPSELPISI